MTDKTALETFFDTVNPSPVQGAASDPVKAAIAKWDSMPDAKMPQAAASATDQGAADEQAVFSAYKKWLASPDCLPNDFDGFKGGYRAALAERAQAAKPTGAVPVIDVWIDPNTLQRSLLDHGTPLAPFDKREFVGSLVWSTDPQDAPINPENLKLRPATTAPEQEAAPTKSLYVEARECGSCLHVGINDSSDTLAACHNCDWSGPSPVEDHCPGCADGGCMGAACPKCGAIYKLLAEASLAAPVEQEAAQVVAKADDQSHVAKGAE